MNWQKSTLDTNERTRKEPPLYNWEKFLSKIIVRWPELASEARDAYSSILWSGDDFERVVESEVKRLVELVRECKASELVAEHEALAKALHNEPLTLSIGEYICARAQTRA